jgi:hypothetical protein
MHRIDRPSWPSENRIRPEICVLYCFWSQFVNIRLSKRGIWIFFCHSFRMCPLISQGLLQAGANLVVERMHGKLILCKPQILVFSYGQTISCLAWLTFGQLCLSASRRRHTDVRCFSYYLSQSVYILEIGNKALFEVKVLNDWIICRTGRSGLYTWLHVFVSIGQTCHYPMRTPGPGPRHIHGCCLINTFWYNHIILI